MSKATIKSAALTTTAEIINNIRRQAGEAYQALVPEVDALHTVPQVGEILFGEPTFVEKFANLLTRIARVEIVNREYANKFEQLVTGDMPFGMTVELIHADLVKVQQYDPEKGAERYAKRSLPTVHKMVGAINWEVTYPLTIQETELRRAFLSEEGVRELINRLVSQIYNAIAYDHELLARYMLIKSITKGEMHAESIGDGTDLQAAAAKFRAMSGHFEFMTDEYNEAGVLTHCPVEDQIIFMDIGFESLFDTKVLAMSFNRDDADYIGKRIRISHFDRFNNARWAEIRGSGDMVEEVTAEELAIMSKVKACLIDKRWFQWWRVTNVMKTADIGSGLYFNYWYHNQLALFRNYFANAVVFVTDEVPALPEQITVEIAGKSITENYTVMELSVEQETPSLVGGQYEFVATPAAIESGIYVVETGAVVFPAEAGSTTLKLTVGDTVYTAQTALTTAANVGDTIVFAKG